MGVDQRFYLTIRLQHRVSLTEWPKRCRQVHCLSLKQIDSDDFAFRFAYSQSDTIVNRMCTSSDSTTAIYTLQYYSLRCRFLQKKESRELYADFNDSSMLKIKVILKYQENGH